MRLYEQFHGEIAISDIGKELRKIIKSENKSFKIMTGYGSTSGNSMSKNAALRSLAKIKKEGMIKGFFPGDVKHKILSPSAPYYNDKVEFSFIVKNDSDYGNDGIIFIFI